MSVAEALASQQAAVRKALELWDCYCDAICDQDGVCARCHALAIIPDPDRICATVEALESISEHGCSSLAAAPMTCPAFFKEDLWCSACVARVAMAGLTKELAS